MEGRTAWIIFDADNTLWAIEHFYDHARDELVRFVSGNGAAAAAVEEFQRQRDKNLHKTYGYSACRFARSFEDTLLHFFPESPADHVRHVRQVALNVFEQRAEVAEGLADVLDLVGRQYQLAIITAGERWVQERRLSDFHLRDRFAAVEIVESKTAATLRDFCERRHVDPTRSWVVGDSPRSDIEPARDAGLGAVHVDQKNWDLERSEITPWDRYRRIRRLAELPQVEGLLRS